MPRAKVYDTAAIERALKHHTTTGALRGFTPPEDGRATWSVDVIGFGTVDLTTAQVYGMTLGLAASERAFRPLDLGGGL